MAIRNLRQLRLLCGLTQFEMAARSNVSMHRIAQAEQGRVELSNTEANLIAEQLRKHWEWMCALDPEGTQSLTADFSTLVGRPVGERGSGSQPLLMPVGAA